MEFLYAKDGQTQIAKLIAYLSNKQGALPAFY
jgi:hypothetical protein